jgi:hypothetical protein
MLLLAQASMLEQSVPQGMNKLIAGIEDALAKAVTNN